MMKSIYSLFCVILFTCFAHAQRDRYHFARTYIGFEGEYISEDNSFSYFNNRGIKKTAKIPSIISPRILIGGTHFWGHADFYISIPLANIKINGSDRIEISNDVFTGFRVLPFQLKENTVRPFAGIGFNSKELRIKNGPLYTNWQWYYEGGFNHQSKNKIIGLEMRFFHHTNYNTAISRTNFESVNVSHYSFSISYKKIFDITSSYSKTSVKKYIEKIYKKAEEKGALSTFSFGLGLSALIPLDKTELASRNAFFNDEIEGNLSVDLGIAYYSSPLDGSIRLSYRPLKQKESAHDYTYQLNRHSLALDAFKFIGDYHGFAPFIGPYISIDRYLLKETDQAVRLIDKGFNKLGYGVVFGWDIKLSNVDYFTLRTNLRYTPQLNYKQGGYKFTVEQLEFNFIQLVFYPERYKFYK